MGKTLKEAGLEALRGDPGAENPEEWAGRALHLWDLKKYRKAAAAAAIAAALYARGRR